MRYDPDELDAKIMLTISEFDGIPSASALGKATGVSNHTILSRMNVNPEINEKMEKRGKEWLDGLNENEFLKLQSRTMRGNMPEYAKEKICNRFDEILFRTIKSLENIPIPSSIARAIGVGRKSVGVRVNANPKINERMEERGEKWLDGLDEKKFLESFSSGEFGTVPRYAREKIGERVDRILFREIKKIEGIPTLGGLAKVSGISHIAIMKRMESNSKISEEMEDQGKKWLNGLDEKEFLKRCSTEKYGGLPEYANRIFDEKLTEILLEKIRAFEGVPTAMGIGREVGLSQSLILRRMSGNPKISEEMEERGKEWIDGLDEKEFLKRCSEWGWKPGLPDYAKEKVNERFDGILLRAIEKFDGVPTDRSLRGVMGVARMTVRKRIKANGTLWMAYQVKRGLTPDQAVELALERGERSDGFRNALNDRLRHLSAFREMVGVIRCFGDLMEKAVSCISLYPDPLAKAAEELGVKVNATHVPMAPLRKAEAPEIPWCGTLIVQGLHRLPEKGLNALFGKIRDMYAEHPELSIITTHSMDYAANDEFFSAMEKNGFRLDESGVIEIGSPDAKTLESYGVPFDDVGRVRRKVSGEFNVLVLGMEKQAEPANIPGLEKAPSGNGDSVILPKAEPVDVPKGMGKELKAKLFPFITVVSPAPFIVDIIEGGKPCAVIGFDMDPQKRNSIEVTAYPNAPAENYRAIAKKLATNLKFRKELGVKPNDVSKIQLSKCRKAMSAVA